MPEEGALSFVLQQLARVLEGSALLFDESGNVLERVGEAPGYLFWSEIADERDRTAPFHVGRWVAMSRRVTTTSQPVTLVLASRSEARTAELAPTYLEVGEIAILAVFSHVRGADVRQRRDREQLLTALEEGIQSSREHRYWPRLREFGFTPYAPLRLAVTERVTRQPLDAAAVAEALDDAGAQGIPVLALTRIPTAESDAIAHVLLPGTPEAAAFLQRRTARSFAGVSAPFTSLLDLPHAVRQAEVAFGVAVRRGLARREADPGATGAAWVDFVQLGLASWLVAEADPLGLRTRSRAVLQPLDEHPELRRTLVTYLAHRQNVNATAAALFVHPNTVRYRLGRAGEVLGDDLAAPWLVTDLYLCLEAEVRAAAELAEGALGERAERAAVV